MAPSLTSTQRKSLQGIAYESVEAGKPPIAITTAPPPSTARLEIHPLLRPSTSPAGSSAGNGAASGYNHHASYNVPRSKLRDDLRRDSGMAPSSSTARQSVATDNSSTVSLRRSPSLPRISGGSATSAPSSLRKFRRWTGYKVPLHAERQDEPAPPTLPETPFLSLPTDIPSITFEDLATPGKIGFSKRGSILIGGKRAGETSTPQDTQSSSGRRPWQSSNPSSSNVSLPVRVLSEEEEKMSQKVRSMYEMGAGEEEQRDAFVHVRLNATTGDIEEEAAADEEASTVSRMEYLHTPNAASTARQRPESRGREGLIQREDQELAGGAEDWSGVQGQDVDRYGFIIERPVTAPGASSTAPTGLHRVSTALAVASASPRRQRSRLHRTPSVNGSLRSSTTAGGKAKDSPTARPSSSQGTYRSTASRLLPMSRDRRAVQEAADMLTLPPGLADIVEQDASGSTTAMTTSAKRREWAREEKWRRMARASKPRGDGGGTAYSFDTRNAKLIQRTWKGIPERWRATAWHAFLTESARRRPQCCAGADDLELMDHFRSLILQSSPDDVQIDLDVPRTISRHIMFRRRYRGGQRLLFRVLHCFSLWLPAGAGYVQGMAALAATLLCYYDEEMAFVMLVRMWQLRGLATLYRPGFAGLLHALEDFERDWLGGGQVGQKVTALNISPTAYGTRWYLTLFNYSIPFAAQLRVWDVFMLLGDPVDSDVPRAVSSAGPPIGTTEANANANADNDADDAAALNGSLDVLHAASAALIDGMREMLLEADFEGAMKLLTSWVPVRDEDVLMRVVRAEWKVHRRRR